MAASRSSAVPAPEVVSPARRRLIAGAAGLAAITGSPAIVRAQTKTIVTTGYGGVYEQRYRKHVLEPFEKKTGAKFVFKYGSANEWLTNAIVNRDDPEIDLPFLSLPLAMKGSQIKDLFLELTPARVPNLRDIDPAFYDVYDRKAVGFNYVDAGLAYRPDMIEKPPAGWADLWDSRFKGLVTLPDAGGGFIHEVIVLAAMLHGGSATNLDPGFAALKRLKPNIVRWYKNPNEMTTALQRKEAGVGLAGSFRTYTLKDSGVPVEYVIPKEGAPVGVLSFHVPVKARNRDLLLEFIDFAIGVGPQTGFGNDMQSGMCNRKVVLDPQVAKRVVPQNRLMRMDWKTIEPAMAKMIERFQREVLAG